MAGVSGHSTKQTLEFIEDAVAAGANYALVLPPSYFGKQTTATVINNFYGEIAEKSRLPIVIYNLPAVCNNIDLDSATIARLAKTHANIVGVKLTCCSVAKVTRLAAELTPDMFSIYGGQSDALIGTLAAGAVGTIAGFANVFPRTIATVYKLYTQGRHNEATELHKKVALAEQHCKSGPASVKYAVAITLPESAGIKYPLDRLKPRRPYVEPEEAAKRIITSQVAPLVDIEAGLRQGAHAWCTTEAHRHAGTEPGEHWAICYKNGNKA
ncbi:dihydrodipicolinate synthetase protein [Pochonia chlamydosporia 170]|uniref:Dihydrodipicolinate synthetase protein n=1 Tax=Pochonia chlamydosporia 170 TaxID=1380566 RepID=A0A179G3G8_METCM|nr:dihydrodipicolinate synthetase protein [Pochonia chlamydosporia 170]OAQ72000.1 dihydrodipicolinate synthetase protein [Pochonia chlamydosporia 170]